MVWINIKNAKMNYGIISFRIKKFGPRLNVFWAVCTLWLKGIPTEDSSPHYVSPSGHFTPNYKTSVAKQHFVLSKSSYYYLDAYELKVISVLYENKNNSALVDAI